MSARPDMGRMGAAGARPDNDTRQLGEMGVIVEAPVSGADGAYTARVHLLHSGVDATAAIAVPWAGAGYGDFLPPEVDDKVFCVPIMGFPDAGWIVAARFWERSTPAPVETQTRGDAVRIGRVDQNVRVATQGTGNAIVEARGGGLVVLGDDQADDPVALKSDWTRWNDALTAAIAAQAIPNPSGAAALQALKDALGNTFPFCALKVRAV